jgi:threonine dehydratase
VPVGGGGLAAGVGLVLAPGGVRVVGVQVEGVDGMARVRRGEGPCVPGATIADGLRASAPGPLATQICARVLDDVIVVPESEVRAAIVELATHDRVLAEGAGAVAGAGLRHGRARRPRARGSGGNIDPATFAALWTARSRA